MLIISATFFHVDFVLIVIHCSLGSIAYLTAHLSAIIRPCHLYPMHRWSLLLQMTHIAWSVCLSVCVSLYAGCTGELCKNGWTDQNVIWGSDSCGSKEPRIRWGPDPPWEGAFLRGRVPAHCNIPKHCLSVTVS